jgi:hypothetical protein
MACVGNDDDLREWYRKKDGARSQACPRALSWSIAPLPWPTAPAKSPLRPCSAELTMLRPFVSCRHIQKSRSSRS